MSNVPELVGPDRPVNLCHYGHVDCFGYMQSPEKTAAFEELAQMMGRLEAERIRDILRHGGSGDTIEREFFVQGLQVVLSHGSLEDLERLQALQQRFFPHRICWRNPHKC